MKLNVNLCYRRKHEAAAFKQCSFDSCSLVNECQSSIREQYSRVDIELNPPEEIFVNVIRPQYSNDVFPSLNLAALSRIGINR